MRKRTGLALELILVVGSLLSAGVAPAQTPEEKARIDYSAAKHALAQGKPAIALAKLEKVVEVLGPVPDLLYFTAEAAFQAGEIAKAQEYIAKTFKAADAAFKKSETYQKLIDLAGKIEVEGAALEAKAKGYWTDEKGLTWTTKDNGYGNIDWNGANAHCQALRLGGFGNWRLPAIDELERMYDPSLPEPARRDLPGGGWTWEGKARVKLPLQLSQGGWAVWSGTRNASDSSQAWYLDFGDGQRYSVPLEGRGVSLRALCVRRSGE
jgi:tetratricopeptide (TPR) repeat protein